MSKVIVRIAPSPTGHLHLGTARTALFNYLWAKNQQGEIILRFEDTDKERSKSEFETEIKEGLKWLGMDFENIDCQILRQTESQGRHQKVLETLWDNEKIFPCFTTKEELDNLRSQAEKNKKSFVFWSPFRDWSREKLQEAMEKNKSFTWRIRCPENHTIVFQDIIRGENKVESNTIGDFVVARSDGSVLYLLANVIDDKDQNVTDIVRGEDHVANTPKQILLWDLLQTKPPKYAHIPLVLDSQRRKLSKRNVDPHVCVLIKDFQKVGFLPEAVINGLAFLGWNPKSQEEIFGIKDLEKIFELKDINAASAQYDFEKMSWYNQKWMGKKDIESLRLLFLAWLKEYQATNFSLIEGDIQKLDKILNTMRKKCKHFSEIFAEMFYFYEYVNPEKTLFTNPKMNTTQESSQKMIAIIVSILEDIEEKNFDAQNIRELSIEQIKKNNFSNGEFLWPFRVALSGKEKSEDPFEIAEILGKAESLRRLKIHN